MFKVKLREIFHTNKEQKETDDNIKINRKLIVLINKLIDELNKCSNLGGYYLYDAENDVHYKFTYKTNDYGSCPRYEISGEKHIDNCSYIVKFNYYYGKIYKFTSTMNANEVNEFSLRGDLLKVIELVENENVSKKANKYCNKIKNITVMK